MLKYTIELSEDTVGILMTIGRSMKIPETLSTVEYLETTIAFLADSIDSQMEPPVANEGDIVTMNEAVEAIMNPDISMDYVSPSANTPAEVEGTLLTFEYIKQAGGAKGGNTEDPIMQEAFCIVYTNLDRDEWDTPLAANLVEKTYRMLQNSQAGVVLDGEYSEEVHGE